ncbi:MAG: hypothetical protein PUP93_21325 [Rhizonema sp. NSF051]|nr:hypothetical protein [Rhizonema sp. NSF051]
MNSIKNIAISSNFLLGINQTRDRSQKYHRGIADALGRQIDITLAPKQHNLHGYNSCSLL